MVTIEVHNSKHPNEYYYWEFGREKNPPFNGNNKREDDSMKKSDQLFIRNIAITVIFGAVGFILGQFPGMLIGLGIALLRKWKFK